MGTMQAVRMDGQMLEAKKWSYKDMLIFLASHQNSLLTWTYKTTEKTITWQRRT